MKSRPCSDPGWFSDSRQSPCNTYSSWEEKQQLVDLVPLHQPAIEWGLYWRGTTASSQAGFSGYGQFLGRNFALGTSRPAFPTVQWMSVLALKLGVCVVHHNTHCRHVFLYQHMNYCDLDWQSWREGSYFRSSVSPLHCQIISGQWDSAVFVSRTHRKTCYPVKLSGVIRFTGSSRPWLEYGCLPVDGGIQQRLSIAYPKTTETDVPEGSPEKEDIWQMLFSS